MNRQQKIKKQKLFWISKKDDSKSPISELPTANIRSRLTSSVWDSLTKYKLEFVRVLSPESTSGRKGVWPETENVGLKRMFVFLKSNILKSSLLNFKVRFYFPCFTLNISVTLKMISLFLNFCMKIVGVKLANNQLSIIELKNFAM